MRRLFDLLFLFLSFSLCACVCVCACVETRTVKISGGNDDKSQTTLRIGRRRHTPVKKEFRRARARAVFSIPRICDLLEPLSQPLFLSISLIQIRDDDDRKSREWWARGLCSLSLFSCSYEKRKNEVTKRRQKSFFFLFLHLLLRSSSRAHNTHHTHHTHTHTHSAVVV